MKKTKLSFARKLVYSALSLLLLVSVVFVLLRLAPGDPAGKFISPELSPQLSEKVKESFMLDRPVYEQYFNFLKNLITGDLGVSYIYRSPVISVIGEFLPFTIIFSVVSLSLQVVISLLLINFMSRKFGSGLDKFLHNFSLTVYSLPTIIIGSALIYIFSVQLNIFPSSGYKSLYFGELGFAEKIFDVVQHMILPVITLSLGGTLIFYNYMRENAGSVMKADFVKYLRAEGCGEREIFRKHVLPNAVGPLVSVLGVELGILLGGALITETIFGLPGIGRLTVNAILARDYPLVTGCALLSGIFVIFANFAADLIKSKIDRRL